MTVNQNQIVHVFSHLPKTGGSTLRSVISSRYAVGAEFFHFAVNGVKSAAKIYGVNPYEELNKLEYSEQQRVILFGHRVNEGMLTKFPAENIELSTMLRHPHLRLVSQYHMRRNARNSEFNQEFKEYVSKNRNVICKFYVERFPSLVDHPYMDLCAQAKSVLSYFKSVEVLERAPDCFNKLLGSFDLVYDSSFNTNRSSAKGYAKKLRLKDVDRKYYGSIKQDLELYYCMYDEQLPKRKIPTTGFLKPNIWLLFLLRITVRYSSKIYPSITSDLILRLINPQRGLEYLDFNVLLDSLRSLEDYDTFSEELQVNLFDVFVVAVSKVEQLPAKNNVYSGNYFERILREMISLKVSRVRDMTTSVVLSFPDPHMISYICKINYYMVLTKRDMAEYYIDLLVRTYPHKPISFITSLKFAQMTEDDQLSYNSKCKIIELDAELPHSSTQLDSF